ncbi:DegQ family serine endoprotease [Deltaproteobacteria bacterium TL4]
MLIRYSKWLTLLILFVLPSVLTYAQDAGELEKLIRASKTRAQLVKQIQKGVVHIRVEKIIKGHAGLQLNNPYDLFNDEFFKRFFPDLQHPRRDERTPNEPPLVQEGLGSGSIVSKDGYILTNHHVVGDADKIVVKLYDGKELQAKLIGTDPQSDIAVIKVEDKDLPLLPIGNSDEIEVGESVIAVGNPFGLSQTVTYGIVSAKGRSNIGIADYEDFIQTDAAINPGNSGGPLLNLRGEIIAVNTAIFSRNGGYQGIGFAVSINMAKQIMESLINTGTVSRGWLGVGIQDVSPDLAKIFNLSSTKGSLVTGVMRETPAEKAQLQKGDVIVSLNDKPIENSNQLRNEIANAKAGTEVKLKINREGSTKNITIVLGERPGDPTVARQENEVEALGMKVQDLTPELAERLGYELKSGVLIAKVTPNSAASKAELKSGMLVQEVNRQSVQSEVDYHRALKSADLKEGVLMLVQTQQGSKYVILKQE